jgi:uncharacterized protein (TIGR02246 family)
MVNRNKEIVDKVNAAFARNDVEGFLAFCADDVEWTMVGEKPVRGKDAIRQWMKAAPAEPPQFSVNQVIADGDFVAACGDMTMKENGQTVPYSYCDVYRFRDGKIAELRAFVVKTSNAAAPSDRAAATV